MMNTFSFITFDDIVRRERESKKLESHVLKFLEYVMEVTEVHDDYCGAASMPR